MGYPGSENEVSMNTLHTTRFKSFDRHAKQSKLVFKEDLQKAIKGALNAIRILENYLEDIEERE
jgi:hypothetical protein